jgi:peptidoglycan/LPS O-acetylase OafA/YrhL
VFIFAFEKGFVSRILKQNIFLYLGKLSYSIYMIHAVILFCALLNLMIIQKFSGIELTPMINEIRYIDFGNVLYNNIAICVTLGTIIFLENFTFKYIEQKGQKLGKKVFK